MLCASGLGHCCDIQASVQYLTGIPIWQTLYNGFPPFDRHCLRYIYININFRFHAASSSIYDTQTPELVKSLFWLDLSQDRGVQTLLPWQPRDVPSN